MKPNSKIWYWLVQKPIFSFEGRWMTETRYYMRAHITEHPFLLIEMFDYCETKTIFAFCRYLTLRLLRSLVSCDASNQPSSSEQDSKTLIQSVFDSTAGGAQDMRIDSELELWDLVEMQLNMECKRGPESVLLLLPCVRDPIYNFKEQLFKTTSGC